MENTLLVRLDRLALIDPASIPRAKREELARARPARGVLLKRAVAEILTLGLTGFAALAYAFFSVCAWMGSAPFFGSGLAVFSAFFIILTAHFRGTCRAERESFMARAPITPRLADEAEAEQAFADAAWKLNALAAAWNEAAALARTHAVSDALARDIDAQRRLLAGRMDAFRLHLRRFNFLTGPRPKLLPPPSDWGHVVPVSLASP